MEGCDACLALHGSRRISQLSDLWQDPTSDPKHPKSVNCVGVGHVIQAARDSGTCKRVVRLTGKGERPWDLFSILLNGLGSMAKAWNYEGEMLLRACPDVEYTIIRPGVMGPMSELPPASLALADNGGDLKVSAIPHAAVADLSIRVLGQPNAARATLCAMTVPEGEGADDWQALLESVSPDPHEVFPRPRPVRGGRAGGEGGPAGAGGGGDWTGDRPAGGASRAAACVSRRCGGVRRGDELTTEHPCLCDPQGSRRGIRGVLWLCAVEWGPRSMESPRPRGPTTRTHIESAVLALPFPVPPPSRLE
ncbi:unnamed protein product [Prorocentrum cordatum]|uniref:NAD(P)-binding domain-containing protein n=1 Tax=Prorocentrum cordatum TaxID=2364126 RepID=A0ABN9ST53_9DINO|nr:unnamed protein product [Polarella glacialis]